MSLSRRQFLKAASCVSAALFIPSYCVRSANGQQAVSDRLRMACIGLGPQGNGDAHGFNGITDIVALCDVDSQYGLKRAIDSKIGRRENGNYIQPDTYSDYRRILDRDDIQVVSIATPDHWHTKIAIEAMQAGKHVFCEKPLTLTLEENLLIRAATKKYGKVFQVGTMQRSMRDTFMTAALLVRKGFLGDIQRTTCIIDNGRESPIIEKAPVPASLDWNLWLGQAPETDFLAGGGINQFDPCKMAPMYSRHHLTFRWWFEYSGGKITDWGAHHTDCALWILNRQKPELIPVKYNLKEATFLMPYKNGFATTDNQYNTPVKFRIESKFSDGTDFIVTSNDKNGNGILLEGTKGRIHVSRGRIAGKLIEDGAHKSFTNEDFSELYNGKPFEGHKQNFIRCIREGGTPVSDIDSNVLSMHVCHLCNIACRLQRDLEWDAANEKFVNDAEAETFFSRKQRKGFELPTLS